MSICRCAKCKCAGEIQWVGQLVVCNACLKSCHNAGEGGQ